MLVAWFDASAPPYPSPSLASSLGRGDAAFGLFPDGVAWNWRLCLLPKGCSITMTLPDSRFDLAAAASEGRRFFDEFRSVLAEILVLPAHQVEQSAIALLVGGDLLLEGHPGLGKRTLAATLARLAGLSFSAISCTPDLGPQELTGAEQLREDAETGKHSYEFLPGPLMANMAYMEDLHRTSPKSLALVADAMRSRQIGYGRNVQDLPSPFMLVASVAPDLDDTDMALRASVTDRFLLQVSLDYPSGSDEWEIGRLSGKNLNSDRQALLSAENLTLLQQAAANVEMADEVLGYAWALVRATRPGNDLAPDFVETWIQLGISPQGLTALVAAAKARALLRGRTESTRRDILEVTQPAFRHRLRGNEEAKAAGLTVERLINMLLQQIALDGEYRPEPTP